MWNKVGLLGRLGIDPELTSSSKGTAIAKFTLATSEKYEGKETTQWHKIVAWGKLAELCKQYLVKGQLILVEGKIIYNTWEKSGQKHTTTEIWIDKFVFVGPRPGPKTAAAGDEIPFNFRG